MALVSTLLLGACHIWDQGFQRNPNLEPLLKNDWDSFFNPVWSPDGRYIYYLRAHRDRIPTPATALGIGGDLWRINLETREAELLLSGSFCSLAISHDGSLLALSYETGDTFPCEMEWEGGPLILADTSGNILDTLPTSLPFILDVEFSSNDAKLYYYAYDTVYTGIPFGFYRINLDGSGEELVREEMNRNLAFFGLIQDTVVWTYKKCRLNPKKENTILFVEGNVILCCSELKIKDLETQRVWVPDADPYGPPEAWSVPSGFESAYWSPDGENLVISVGEVRGGDVIHASTLELWVLHNVWEEGDKE